MTAAFGPCLRSHHCGRAQSKEGHGKPQNLPDLVEVVLAREQRTGARGLR